jgi:RNA-directed DNA polymerase
MKKRWDFAQMLHAGQKLFKSIHRRKRMASPNHDVHLLGRSINEWLPQGIQSLIEGTRRGFSNDITLKTKCSTSFIWQIE